MESKNVAKMLDSDINIKGDVYKIGQIKHEYEEYANSGVSTDEYNSLTVKQFMSYYKVDRLKELGVISDKMVETLKDMLDNYYELNKQVAEINYYECMNDVDKEEEKSKIYYKINILEKELESYHLIQPIHADYLTDYIDLEIEHETNGKVRARTRKNK
jgi:hypothetical protein